jgi:hypothetical protein
MRRCSGPSCLTRNGASSIDRSLRPQWRAVSGRRSNRERARGRVLRRSGRVYAYRAPIRLTQRTPEPASSRRHLGRVGRRPGRWFVGPAARNDSDHTGPGSVSRRRPSNGSSSAGSTRTLTASSSSLRRIAPITSVACMAFRRCHASEAPTSGTPCSIFGPRWTTSPICLSA